MEYSTAGLDLGGGGVLPMAVGGREDVEIRDQATHRGLAIPYRASAGPRVLVSATSGAVVSLRAGDAGADELRITDPSTGLQVGRVELSAAPIASIALTDTLLGQPLRVAQGRRPPALWAGGLAVPMVVVLRSADGGRLIDQDLTLEAGTAAAVTKVAWDVFSLSAPRPGALPLRIKAGDQPAQVVTLPVVAEIDDLEGTLSSSSPIHLGDAPTICFEAGRGAYRIVGVPWAFALTGPATIGPFWDPNCVTAEPTGPGEVQVTATVAGRSVKTTFPVVAVDAR